MSPLPARADEGKTVANQANDQMQYDVKSVDAAVGQTVTITLTNAGKLPKVAMAHNLVLLKAGHGCDRFRDGRR